MKEEFKEITPETLLHLLDDKKRGAPKEAKEIKFEYIADILNYARNGKKIKTLPKTSEAYKKWVNKEIEKLEKKVGMDLKGNIIISDIENSELGNSVAGSSPAIAILGLRFLVEKKIEISFTPSFMMHFGFTHNTFLSTEDSYSSISMSLDGGGFISFSNNKLKHVLLDFTPGEREINKHAEIENNEIFIISASTDCRIHFNPYNEIKRIYIFSANKQKTSSIKWGPYQKVDAEGEYADFNREAFIILKQIAIRKGDRLQESFLNQEILKCDEHTLKKEIWRNPWQDKYIYLFGKIVSNHGVSWVRPLFWLLAMNAIFTFLIFLIVLYEGCMMDLWEWANIWAKMFNPLNNLSEAIGIDNFLVSIISAIQKTVFAILVYELIRVGRRFTPK